MRFQYSLFWCLLIVCQITGAWLYQHGYMKSLYRKFNPFHHSSQSSAPSGMASNEDYRTVAYFVNWAIYGRDHHPQDLPAESLTHVLYAFANVRPESGEVYLTDTWSDLEKHYPGDSWNDPGGPNLYGCLKQLALLKRKHRHFHTLLSIGGWTYSSNFPGAAASPASRHTFAATAVKLLADAGFDGLDIDWEYPQSPREATDFVALLAAVRAELDKYADRVGQDRRAFLLTVACPAGPANFERLDVKGMDRYLDFWNVMAYDYAGSWDSVAGHQANAFPSRGNPRTTPFSTEAAIGFYRSKGVAPSKLVLGCPLYGRAFANCPGGLGTPFSGVGEGSWEAGVWDWKALPRPGAHTHEDEHLMASWCQDDNGTVVSFDTGNIAARKAQWVMQQVLGGVMWWESSGDRKGPESMIARQVGELGHKLQWQRHNTIQYPESRYENLRTGNLK